jgi:hypothetical protein
VLDSTSIGSDPCVEIIALAAESLTRDAAGASVGGPAS